MSKVKLNKQINTLFGYCKSKNIWEISIDDKPYELLIYDAQIYFTDLQIWSFDLFDNFFVQRFLTFKTKSSITTSDIDSLIDLIETDLKANIQKNITIFPLIGAVISNSVFIGDFAIIATNNNDSVFSKNREQDDIIKEINTFSQIENEKIKDAIVDVCRVSNGFLEYPLLVLIANNQFHNVANIDRAYYIIKRLISFVRVLSVYAKSKESIFGKNELLKCKHFVCVGEKLNSTHLPIHFDFELKFDLDYLSNSDYQNRLKDMKLVLESGQNDLRIRYLKSIKFLNWALQGREFAIDDLTLKVLFSLISAETLMIGDTSGEKKMKLANAIITTANTTKLLTETELENYRTLLIYLYKDRNSIVHFGEQYFFKYTKDYITDKKDSEGLDICIYLMSDILVNFPSNFYNNCLAVNPAKPQDEWIKYLVSIKYRIQYNMWQKIGLFLRNGIEKLFKLKLYE